LKHAAWQDATELQSRTVTASAPVVLALDVDVSGGLSNPHSVARSAARSHSFWAQPLARIATATATATSHAALFVSIICIGSNNPCKPSRRRGLCRSCGGRRTTLV